ncbi:hypothetical protein MNBD_NITROSPINAE02-1950 [hydrothermal vent metagenome]|uniref:Uncharacterized protein n=1 Tax=hydrothermal vent metagenome TaxID=652676 RepID=A0A3B1BXC1_9ZZZZ
MSIHKREITVILFIVYCLAWPTTASAQGKADDSTGAGIEDILGGFDDEPKDASQVDDILGGFDDAPAEMDKTADESGKAAPSPVELGGSYTLASSYNYAHKAPEEGKTDYRGLSRLRSELQIDIDIGISEQWKAFVSGRTFYDAAYAINGRDNYTDKVLDTYEAETEFRDMFIQGTLTPNLDVKIGRQIIVWGKSDNVRVTDVLNPFDNREPGMVDIEDLRLPVTATRLDYYFDQWSVTAIAIHEIRFNKNPAYGSDFYPFDYVEPYEEKPGNSMKNWEYALALNGIFKGWDISFYYARIFGDYPYGEVARVAGAAEPIITLKHNRLQMYGVSANWAVKSWLIKAEAAYFDRLKYSFIQEEAKGRFDVLAGVEYAGFSDNILSLEIVNRHIMGYDQKMEATPDATGEDQFQSFFRYSGDFYNARLHILFLFSLFDTDGSDGGFGRLQAKYDIVDTLSVTAGVVTYQSGENLFFNKIGDNDRIFVDLKRSF